MSAKFLVTAGNTRERIDAVRDWGNIFTGNTGLAIARALSAYGAVDLLTSNAEHLKNLPAGVTGVPFTDHASLRTALAARVLANGYSAIFMTAAVADYRPTGAYEIVQRQKDPTDSSREIWTVRNVQEAKVRSHFDQIAFAGQRTEKLVDLFRTEWGYQGILVKFKLEVAIDREQLLTVAEASRQASGADYLVANTLEMVNGPEAGAYLLSDGGKRFIARGDLAGELARLVGG